MPTMTEILLYAVGVLVFVVAMAASIALHEMGHLLTAKRFGARVSEFMIGFGPTLFSFQRGETRYGVKLIPLGGFVKIIGMLPPARGESVDEAIARAKLVTEQRTAAQQDESAASDRGEQSSMESTGVQTTITLPRGKKNSFRQVIDNQRIAEFAAARPSDKGRLFYELSPWKKIIVMAAGPVVNLMIAFVVFQAMFGLYGTTTTAPTGSTQVTSVSECVIPERENRTTCADDDPVAPSHAAGLAVGDEIVAFNGTPVSSWDELAVLIEGNGAGTAAVEVIRDGERIALTPTHTVTMERDVSDDRSGDYQTVGFFGAGPETETIVERHGPIYTLNHMGELVGHTVSIIAQLPEKVWNVAQAITGNAERDPEGPMSIVGGSRMAGEVAASDIAGLGIAEKAVMLGTLVGGLNLFLGVFNLIPLLPLDGGHIIGSLWEMLRRGVARIRKRAAPRPVDIARQLPISIVITATFIAVSAVLILGDLVVPLSSGL